MYFDRIEVREDAVLIRNEQLMVDSRWLLAEAGTRRPKNGLRQNRRDRISIAEGLDDESLVVSLISDPPTRWNDGSVLCSQRLVAGSLQGWMRWRRKRRNVRKPTSYL